MKRPLMLMKQVTALTFIIANLLWVVFLIVLSKTNLFWVQSLPAIRHSKTLLAFASFWILDEHRLSLSPILLVVLRRLRWVTFWWAILSCCQTHKSWLCFCTCCFVVDLCLILIDLFNSDHLWHKLFTLHIHHCSCWLLRLASLTILL